MSTPLRPANYLLNPKPWITIHHSIAAEFETDREYWRVSWFAEAHAQRRRGDSLEGRIARLEDLLMEHRAGSPDAAMLAIQEKLARNEAAHETTRQLYNTTREENERLSRALDDAMTALSVLGIDPPENEGEEWTVTGELALRPSGHSAVEAAEYLARIDLPKEGQQG